MVGQVCVSEVKHEAHCFTAQTNLIQGSIKPVEHCVITVMNMTNHPMRKMVKKTKNVPITVKEPCGTFFPVGRLITVSYLCPFGTQ